MKCQGQHDADHLIHRFHPNYDHNDPLDISASYDVVHITFVEKSPSAVRVHIPVTILWKLSLRVTPLWHSRPETLRPGFFGLSPPDFGKSPRKLNRVKIAPKKSISPQG